MPRFLAVRGCRRCKAVLLVAGIIVVAALFGATVALAQTPDGAPLPDGILGEKGLLAGMIAAIGYMAKRLSECVSPAEVSRLNTEITRAHDQIERTREQRDEWMMRAITAESRLSPPRP